MTKRRLIWSAYTATLLALGYFGVARSVPGAANALMFAIGALATLNSLSLFQRPAEPLPHRAVPQLLSASLDVLAVMFLSWHGWFWCAAGWTWSSLCSHGRYKQPIAGKAA